MPVKKEYSNGEITVVWQPEMCIHSENCFHGLPKVFNPKNRPWVQLEQSESKTIMDQVNKCPSGALSYYKNDGSETSEDVSGPVEINVSENGPLMIKGELEVKFPEGKTVSRSKITAFCRCGHSQNKPFCDGSHKAHDFQG